MEDETQETQNTQGSPETLEAIKAELEAERQAKATAEAALAQKEALITDLQNQLSEVKSRLHRDEAAAAELNQAKEAYTKAVAKYLDVVKATNPTIPGDVIVGATIEEIDASVEKGKGIVEAVKKAIEAEASQAKVPAGAPTRGEISLEGLTPREKIAAGIQQKGGM